MIVALCSRTVNDNNSFLEQENIVLCALSNNQKTLEKASDICLVKLKPFLKILKIQNHAIILALNNSNLLSDRKKIGNCKSKEYKLYTKRIIAALNYAGETDCRIVLDYGEDSDSNKLRYCRRHYSDEIKLEMNMLAGQDNVLYNRISDCGYANKEIKPMLDFSYLASKN